MNADLQRYAFENAGQTTWTTREFVAGTLAQERPRLPAPHQVAQELWKTVVDTRRPPSAASSTTPASRSRRPARLPVRLGAGHRARVLIVHVRSLDRSLMPWIIASQTIPIIALAPMIVVILNQLGITGIVPKALIAAYLSFFPVTVGMVKGLRSPDPLQLDLMRTYSRLALQTFWSCAVPASVPFLFASLKVGGRGEPRRRRGRRTADRPMAGSARGCWRAPIMGRRCRSGRRSSPAALCACGLIAIVAFADRVVLKRMGTRAGASALAAPRPLLVGLRAGRGRSQKLLEGGWAAHAAPAAACRLSVCRGLLVRPWRSLRAVRSTRHRRAMCSFAHSRWHRFGLLRHPPSSQQRAVPGFWLPSSLVVALRLARRGPASPHAAADRPAAVLRICRSRRSSALRCWSCGKASCGGFGVAV